MKETGLDLTRAAKDQMYKTLVVEVGQLEEYACFRLVQKNDRLLTLTIDRPRRSDSTVEHYDHTILAIPEAVQSFVKDKQIDFGSDGKLRFSKKSGNV